MPMRKVIKRGYYNKRVYEIGDEADVPATLKASWLEKPKRQAKKANKAEEPAAPEMTPEADESNDNAG